MSRSPSGRSCPFSAPGAGPGHRDFTERDSPTGPHAPQCLGQLRGGHPGAGRPRGRSPPVRGGEGALLKALLASYSRESAPERSPRILRPRGHPLRTPHLREAAPFASSEAAITSAASPPPGRRGDPSGDPEPPPAPHPGGQPYGSVNDFNAELERVLYDGDYSPTNSTWLLHAHPLPGGETTGIPGHEVRPGGDFAAYASALEAPSKAFGGGRAMVKEGEW